jgi:hypothetical protein
VPCWLALVIPYSAKPPNWRNFSYGHPAFLAVEQMSQRQALSNSALQYLPDKEKDHRCLALCLQLQVDNSKLQQYLQQKDSSFLQVSRVQTTCDSKKSMPVACLTTFWHTLCWLSQIWQPESICGRCSVVIYMQAFIFWAPLSLRPTLRQIL